MPPVLPARARSILPALLVLLAGCSQEMPPERMETTTVTGRVHIGSRAVHGGWVEFLPVDGAVGPLRSAPLGPRGGFVASGVAVGRNAIRIVDPPFPLPEASPNPGIRFDQFSSPIRRDVRPSDSLDIDLLTERARFALLGSNRPPAR